MTTPIVDYVPRLDERNKLHRVEAIPADVSVFWTGGLVLDQGQEGSCVGHGVTGEYFASPVRGRVPGVHNAFNGHLLAVQVYNRAKEIDEWEGVNYDGTSVRAGMLVGRERGWWEGFKWAFNMEELKAALRLGPVVVGISVYDSMFDTLPNGDWVPSGPEVGGHCALITGYSTNYYRRGPRFRIRNSWGADWGKDGNAYISPENLDKILFQAGGEAAVPVDRKLA